MGGESFKFIFSRSEGNFRFAGDFGCDLDGNPIPALAGYAVTVAVADVPLNGVPAKRIAVTVSRGADALTLVGYRTGWAL